MDLILQFGLFLSFALFVAGAIASLVFDRFKDTQAASVAAHACAALGGLAGLTFGLTVIASGSELTLRSSMLFGFAGAILSLHIDALAAFFISVISIVTIAASIFGLGYQKQFYGIYRLGQFGFFYSLFLASMILVVSANNALLFLFAWELMAITSYFLVIFERRSVENIRAGMLYILVTQFGTAFLFSAFLVLHNLAGSWNFDAMRAVLPGASMTLQNVILALALVGFGTKAGIIPLHIWLPEAHPAAPSHISALMSGVMVKTAIFMIIRFFIDFFPVVSPYWGLIILGFGAVSSVLGVLYALSEHDIKRMLAFSSVENVGIILLGVGASVTFFAFGAPLPGIVALTAALYHTMNHAVFKGLLFLAAGSVVHATHTRNMEAYGGLIKKMPFTAFFFLLGACAIAGLPPLNGFVSEWFTYQSLFAGIASLPLFAKTVFIFGLAALAFTGGLAAACFVMAFGTTFLARPRAQVQEKAHESALSMRLGMGLLAVFVVVLGISASFVTPLLTHIAEATRGFTGSPVPFVHMMQPIGFAGFSTLSIMWVAIALLAGGLLTYGGVWLVARHRKVVIARTWDCGAPLGPRMEITATGFSRALITIFQGLLRPAAETDIEYQEATSRYFATSKTVRLRLPDLYHAYLYGPAASIIERGGRYAKRVQTGNLNVYLLYMFIALIALLTFALQ